MPTTDEWVKKHFMFNEFDETSNVKVEVAVQQIVDDIKKNRDARRMENIRRSLDLIASEIESLNDKSLKSAVSADIIKTANSLINKMK